MDPHTDVEGDDDVDPDTIDEIDGLPGGGRRGRRNLRRLDSSSELDIMVSLQQQRLMTLTAILRKDECSNALVHCLLIGPVHQRSHVRCGWIGFRRYM